MSALFGGIKFKLYSVSLSAAKVTDALGDEKSQFYWEHNSAIITAPDMEGARESCEVMAFNSWPFDDGWSNHSAAVTEVTNSFIREVLALHQNGVLADTTPEAPHFFRFDPPHTTTH